MECGGCPNSSSPLHACINAYALWRICFHLTQIYPDFRQYGPDAIFHILWDRPKGTKNEEISWYLCSSSPQRAPSSVGVAMLFISFGNPKVNRIEWGISKGRNSQSADLVDLFWRLLPSTIVFYNLLTGGLTPGFGAGQRKGYFACPGMFNTVSS